MRKNLFDPQKLLSEFDHFLYQKGIKFEAVVIGSGALTIMGFLQRQTVDIDVLDPKIPAEVLKLAEEFRVQKEKKGSYLIENWINNGPDKLLLNLPKNWSSRTQAFFSGKALIFVTLGRRPDLLKDKLWGFCDLREQDKSVILALKPLHSELLEAAKWVKDQDAHPFWSDHVDSKVKELCGELGIDVLDPKIPAEVSKLAEEFRVQKEKEGSYLIENWISNGPDKLLLNLPKNWSSRTQAFFSGKALIFVTLGRPDLLKDKLWGFCDLREQDKSVILVLKAFIQ